MTHAAVGPCTSGASGSRPVRRAKLVCPTARALEAERAGREVIADLRSAWAELIGAEEMDALEAGLRRLRAALWPGD